jgi:hypothetical protein
MTREILGKKSHKPETKSFSGFANIRYGRSIVFALDHNKI